MTSDRSEAQHVVIAGGGVAALEAALALRALAAGRANVTVLAPDRHFTYRPLSVGEPFGQGHATRYELQAIADDRGFAFVRDAIATVDADGHELETQDGYRIRYDRLLLALGARARRAVEGAVAFRGPQDAARVAEALRAVPEGGHVVFAVAPEPTWTLPVYELALLTASWSRRRERPLEVSVVSPEGTPLEVFGTGVSAEVAGVLERAGVRFRGGVPAREYAHDRLALAEGESVAADLVIALPRLEGPAVAGIPSDESGFVKVDEFCRVLGVDDVYAVGDMTALAVKQGGLAAQQAVVAATAIAFGAGADVVPQPYRPVLRALMLTGETPRFLRSDRDASEMVSGDSPWWPPHKIATRYLAPYLGGAGREVAAAGGDVISSGLG